MWFNSKIRAGLTNTWHVRRDSKRLEFRFGRTKHRSFVAVVNKCREMLSPAASATSHSCHHLVGHSKELPVISWRKVGMTSSPHGPYVLATRATMASTMEASVTSNWNPKSASVHCTLQLKYMKLELLVIADPLCQWMRSRVLYTPRLFHGVGSPKASLKPLTTVCQRLGWNQAQANRREPAGITSFLRTIGIFLI